MSDSLLEVYVYENLQLLEQLEGILLAAEKSGRFETEQVGAIFRILHTIKGSSGMMDFDALMRLSHAVEDLFSCIRENPDLAYDHRTVFDLVFAAEDFLRGEMDKLQSGVMPSSNADALIRKITLYHRALVDGTDPPVCGEPAQSVSAPGAQGEQAAEGAAYRVKVLFDAGCKMENIRAFGVLRSVQELCLSVRTVPESLFDEQSESIIAESGFELRLVTDASREELEERIRGNFFVRSLEIFPDGDESAQGEASANGARAVDAQNTAQKQNYMSVKLDKLDKLLNLVGEIVITETTVTKNPEVLRHRIASFEKASRQLRKLTDELQDTVMALRMVPISATFHRLERIVRDMCRKTGKRAELIIRGEETEMDKSVIDNLFDPLMHLIRNSVDHGIEPPEERARLGKNPVGKITVSAENTGGEVVVSVSDDGAGLDREKLIRRGIERGLLKKPENEVTDREAYALIFTPGFSTNDAVTEFSGRGVGMDVAMRSIEEMGGTSGVSSVPGRGMTMQMRIPLTLAIIDGMQVSVGGEVFIVPLLSIQKSFRPKKTDLFTDPGGREMLLLRGKCYPVARLSKLYGVENAVTAPEKGILVLIEGDHGSYCLMVDSLIGEQQTVVKPLPAYISRYRGWTKGIAGCTILGDGGVSLIIDVNDLLAREADA